MVSVLILNRLVGVVLDTINSYYFKELQQSRQQLSLGDLKLSLGEVKIDSHRKMTEYQVNT